MVHSSILWHVFEFVCNRSQFFGNKNEDFKPRLLQFQELSVLAQTFGSLCNSAYFKNVLLKFLAPLRSSCHSRSFLVSHCNKMRAIHHRLCDTLSLREFAICTFWSNCDTISIVKQKFLTSKIIRFMLHLDCFFPFNKFLRSCTFSLEKVSCSGCIGVKQTTLLAA